MLFKMIANSLNSSGEPLTVDPMNTNNKYEFSDNQIQYILKKLRKQISSQATIGNWEDLSPLKIHSSFGPTPNPADQKTILDLVAPI